MLDIRLTWIVTGLLAVSMVYFSWVVVGGDAFDAPAHAHERGGEVPFFSAGTRPILRTPAVPESVAEGASPVDTTGLLKPAQSVDEVLDLVDDDLGPGGQPVDRAALAAALRSDPELLRALQPQDSPGAP